MHDIRGGFKSFCYIKGAGQVAQQRVDVLQRLMRCNEVARLTLLGALGVAPFDGADGSTGAKCIECIRETVEWGTPRQNSMRAPVRPRKFRGTAPDTPPSSLTQVNHLREGQIIAPLHDHGADLKWEKPCSNKTFARPGRSYVKNGAGVVRPVARTGSKGRIAARITRLTTRFTFQGVLPYLKSIVRKRLCPAPHAGEQN